MARSTKPETFHAAVALALALALSVALAVVFSPRMTGPTLLLCWLAGVNVIAFGYYGYDKMRARAGRTRVPEAVLHGIALAGGTLGAYAGMRAFRHKTVKGPFRVLFWLIASLQVLLVAAAVYRIWWLPA
jgi:uncharacterized membrane protein YsdA (DUF1294 family)